MCLCGIYRVIRLELFLFCLLLYTYTDCSFTLIDIHYYEQKINIRAITSLYDVNTIPVITKTQVVFIFPHIIFFFFFFLLLLKIIKNRLLCVNYFCLVFDSCRGFSSKRPLNDRTKDNFQLKWEKYNFHLWFLYYVWWTFKWAS